MTAHTHDPATLGDGLRPESAPTDGASTISSRPRWLVPGLLVLVVVGALVVAGVVEPSTVLYAGLFGGMILMHVGGHGHGGHGGHGAGGPGGQGTGGPGGHGADAQEPEAGRTDQARDDDQRPFRGCH